MLVVGIVLSIGLLGVIAFLALSKKSEKLIKKLALIALIVIGLSIIASAAIVIIFDKPPEEPIEFQIPGLMAPQPKTPDSSNSMMILIFAIVLVLFLGMIIYLSLKEQKKKNIPAKK
jgi:predicted membrane channel-forming protein YqfA (hemolysin III family)